MKRILVLLALVALAGPTLAKPPSMIAAPTHPKVVELFAAACEFSELDCEGLSPPFMMVMETGRPLGFHIYGTNIVFISDECFGRVVDELKCDAITVHEMTHYIVSELDFFPEDPDRCLTEGVAWKAYNAYAKTQPGSRDVIRKNWQREYPECRK